MNMAYINTAIAGVIAIAARSAISSEVRPAAAAMATATKYKPIWLCSSQSRNILNPLLFVVQAFSHLERRYFWAEVFSSGKRQFR
ncbi:hypothetical protein [Geopseudomonas aromaticivorans]|uniref:hypothetical protein n=1 Tax=Geopseudomonas aromaticivorans TaxID=2849492 RepID=UPI0020C9158A|nr:hypothetical protein [Pseudomonas aromaticivorans]